MAARRRLWLALPLVLGALAYANAVGNGFVLDDHHFLVDNPDTFSLNLLARLWQPTVTTVTEFYRPLAVYLQALEHALFGLRPALYHLDSIAVHLGCTALVMRLAERVNGRLDVAVWAGVLFAVHPVHVEAVTAIANRSEMLATLFYLLALDRAWSKGRSIVGLSALYLCALLAKESAITLPLAVAVLWTLPNAAEKWWRAMVLAPGLALYLALRAHAFGNLAGDTRVLYFRQEGTLERALTSLKFLATDLRLLIYPTRLLPDYSRFTITNARTIEPAVLVGALFVIALLTAAWIGRRSLLGLGAALTAIALLPYSHLIPMSGPLAERFLYLPSVGCCWMVAALGGAAAQRLSRPWIVSAAVGVATLWMIARTLDRNLDWRSDLSLWSAAVETAPDNGAAHCLLADAWYGAGQKDRAMAELEAGARIYPWSLPLTLKLAGWYHAAGRHDDERRVLKAAVDSGRYDDQIAQALRAASWVGHDAAR